MKALILLLILPLQLLSQDISGIWTGLLHTKGNDLLFELVISENKEKSSGYSLTVFTIDGIENVGVKSVIIKKKKGSIYFEDKQLIYDNYSIKAKRVKLYGNLSLNLVDSIMTLSGEFRTRLVHYESPENRYYTGTITLQKQKNSAETRLIPHLDKMNLLNTLSFQQQSQEKEKEKVATTLVPEPLTVVIPKQKENQAVSISKNDQPTVIKTIDITPLVKPAAAIVERSMEIIHSVFFRSDSLVLSLYDNGTVDGDTVSVVLNGRIIMARKGLTGNALRVVVQTRDLGDSLLLVMYAENLGLIPPNTGILIIQDGNERNEIRFEGNLQKSSAVILRRRR